MLSRDSVASGYILRVASKHSLLLATMILALSLSTLVGSWWHWWFHGGLMIKTRGLMVKTRAPNLELQGLSPTSVRAFFLLPVCPGIHSALPYQNIHRSRGSTPMNIGNNTIEYARQVKWV